MQVLGHLAHGHRWIAIQVAIWTPLVSGFVLCFVVALRSRKGTDTGRSDGLERLARGDSDPMHVLNRKLGTRD